MKLKKLLLLVIAMQLCSLKSYAQWNDSIPLRGREQEQIDSNVVISISYIKQANAKMIERLYLKEICNQQDTIIKLKDKYIKEQQAIINSFQERVITSEELNQRLYKSIDRQRKKKRIFLGTTIGASLVALLSFIHK